MKSTDKDNDMVNDRLPQYARVAILITLAFIASGCASSRGTVDSTKAAWQSDSYVPVESDPCGHASRVLDMAPEPANQTMQVGALRLPLHGDASVTSSVIAWLDQGAAVTVTEWSRFVRAPETASMIEAGERELVPTWARVDCGDGVTGYVGARSLVSPRLYASMDEEASRELVEGSGGEAAGQGFSEKRKKRLVAVKGAAGAFSREGSDYKGADRLLESATLVGGVSGFSGRPLLTHDPVLASQIRDEMAASEKEKDGDEGSSGGGMLGGLGGTFGLKSDEAELALAVTEILVELMAESDPTPMDEYMLARECMAAVLASAPVVPSDDPRSLRLSEIGRSISISSSLPYPLLGYQFILQDDDETINAFASPGGAIFFTTAMLDFLETDEELAAIIGHEIAHVEERHGVKLAMENGFNKMPAFRKIFALVAEDQLEATVDDLIAEVDLPAELKAKAREQIKNQVVSLARDGFEELMTAVIEGIQTGDSQASETAADLRGMSLAAATGYDPSGLGSVLSKLEAATGTYGGANYSGDRLGESQEVAPLLMAGFEELMVERGGPISVAPVQRAESMESEPASGESDPEPTAVVVAAEAAAAEAAAAEVAAAEVAAAEVAAAEAAAAEAAAAEAAAAEVAAAEAAAAEVAAAEAAAAAEVAAAEAAAAAAAEAAAAEAAAEAARPRGFSFQVRSPEASSIRQSFHDECQAMGDWTTVPSNELVAGIAAHLKRAAADGKPIQRCDATYLMLGHDDMQTIPACPNGGTVFMEGNDGSIPHVYLVRKGGRVSDDSIGTAGRRSQLTGDLSSTRDGGRVGRSLRPGDSLLVWDRWDNTKAWNGWVIILEK